MRLFAIFVLLVRFHQLFCHPYQNGNSEEGSDKGSKEEDDRPADLPRPGDGLRQSRAPSRPQYGQPYDQYPQPYPQYQNPYPQYQPPHPQYQQPFSSYQQPYPGYPPPYPQYQPPNPQYGQVQQYGPVQQFGPQQNPLQPLIQNAASLALLPLNLAAGTIIQTQQLLLQQMNAILGGSPNPEFQRKGVAQLLKSMQLPSLHEQGIESQLYKQFMGEELDLPQFAEGYGLIEGDQLMEEEDCVDCKMAQATHTVLWPNGRIPYTYHQSVKGGLGQRIKKFMSIAIKHYEYSTCIRFVEKEPDDEYFALVRSDFQGCWSLVGKRLNKKGVGQDMNLGAGCDDFETVIHEMGHVVGYYHEHARSDRDDFVTIRWKSVKEGLYNQFNRRQTLNEKVPYDFRSVMQYPAWAFSKDPFLEETILAVNPLNQRLLDEERLTLSFFNMKLTNQLYNCSDACPNKDTLKCQNGGYLSPYQNDGQDCKCVCNVNYYGDKCENSKTELKTLPKDIPDSIRKDQSVYGSLKCGRIIEGEEGTIFTPGYPNRLNPYESCSWWIKAPVDHLVRVNFTDFSFRKGARMKDASSPMNGRCIKEKVEIRRLEDINEPEIYCGEDIKPGTVMDSESDDFIILIVADSKMRGRGLKAHISYVKKGDSS